MFKADYGTWQDWPLYPLQHEEDRLSQHAGLCDSEGEMKRDWDQAREKVNREGRCRFCGSNQNVEAAHIIGRDVDPILTGPRGGKFRLVHEDAIVPLCGPFAFNNCHGHYDAHELDILSVLTIAEQSRAVEDGRGMLRALRRISGRRVADGA
jgi:hypothetical protein